MLTDGRFSGATRGFCVGHVSPEAAVGGTIALIRDGDKILIDANKGIIEVKLKKMFYKLKARKKNLKKKKMIFNQVLYGSFLRMLVQQDTEQLLTLVLKKKKKLLRYLI